MILPIKIVHHVISSYNINNSDVINCIQNCFVLLDNISSRTKGIANLNELSGKGPYKSIDKCKSKICKLQA